MSRVVLLLVLVALWMFPHKCRAQVAEPAGQTDAAIKGAAGINGVWFDANGSVPPSDFEVGAVARASGQHHLSLVGAVWYGIDHSYLRAVIGPVVTATDVDDRNFSVGLGIQRQLSSQPDLRPEEWIVHADVGWKPYEYEFPRLILVAQGGYGLSTQQVSALAGVRYEIGGGR